MNTDKVKMKVSVFFTESFRTAIGMIALFFLVLWALIKGWEMAEANVIEHCEDYGRFKINERMYQCEQVGGEA